MARTLLLSGLLCCLVGGFFGVFGAIEDDVKFFLLTIENPMIRQELIYENESSITSSNYNDSRPTRVLIHGFVEDSYYTFALYVSTAYLTASDVNVIFVEYGKIAQKSYLTASSSVPDIGKYVAEFLDFLDDTAGLSFPDLFLIGFSLGAHIAGYVGKNVQNGQITAIHALDPPFFLFPYNDPAKRLSSTDANYVQVFHTAANSFGYWRPIGDVDIYPNYGMTQPACSNLNVVCSHERSFRYFGLSLLEPTRYLATRCTSAFSLVFLKTCLTTGDTTYINESPQPLSLDGIYYFSSND